MCLFRFFNKVRVVATLVGHIINVLLAVNNKERAELAATKFKTELMQSFEKALKQEKNKLDIAYIKLKSARQKLEQLNTNSTIQDIFVSRLELYLAESLYTSSLHEKIKQEKVLSYLEHFNFTTE